MTSILYRGKRLASRDLLRILFLIAVVTVVEVPIAFMVILRLPREVDLCGSERESTLEVRGVIDRISFNERVEDSDIGGLRPTYHIFPAMITINVTQVLWYRYNYTGWQAPSRLRIGYEFEDGNATKLGIGFTIETKGRWFPIIDHSPYLRVFLVAPCVSDSYLGHV